MNKHELIYELKERVEKRWGKQVRRELIEIGVEELLSLIVEEVRRGGEIKIRDFGKFYLKETSPRTARNPRTGEKVRVPARKVFAFKPGKNIRIVEVK